MIHTTVTNADRPCCFVNSAAVSVWGAVAPAVAD